MLSGGVHCATSVWSYLTCSGDGAGRAPQFHHSTARCPGQGCADSTSQSPQRQFLRVTETRK
ncbi:hypothetical protein ARTHRO9AX_70071 [Arthrobacter sp. 9AX]|nr:hypothetical protein ARTHRO9AX_70071 [Arthrobacter sp. 9AX]